MFKKPIVLSAFIALTASASMAEITDSCLIGTWVPVPGAFAEQFSANPGMEQVEISGSVQMHLSAAGGQYVLDGMEIKMQQAGIPPMSVAMSGTGGFSGNAAAGQFSFIMGDFDYAAKATVNVGSAPMVMEIPFTEEMAPMGRGAQGSYSCSDTALIFNAESGDEKMINSWVRQ